MNILFSNVYEVTPFLGGTERITHRIASAFKQRYKYRCYLSYRIPNNDKTTDNIFDAKFQIKKSTSIKELTQFIKRYSINYIIIQGVFKDVIIYKEAIKDIPKCKIIFTHHFEPKAEKNFFLFKDFLHDALKYKTIKKYIKIPLYPYFRGKYLKQLPIQYQKAYKNSDALVLLMKDFISPYMKYAKLSDNKKFTCIPNMLSYNEFCSIDDIENKEKTILIVSRLDERFKRILLALKIWEDLKKQSCAKEWKLKIIGAGDDYHKYIAYIKKNHLTDVYFLGRQDPIQYYKESSLFLMTSISESWGLTITEAQQFGVIPIAFDCFPSLKEIISDQYNGFLVPENQLSKYANILKELIVNEKKRKEVAKNCIESSKKYSEAIIIEKWNNLLLNLNNESKL